ncbi:MAG: sugar phosphate isomerase/epimerase [Chloroflexota bacterium]|nr:sugar phosphate isomerase/epimerase [Chloroflexota bacterium]
MEPGIFETTFPRPTLEATLDAVAAHGLRWVQFDLASVGLPTLPDRIPDTLVERTRRETAARGIRLAAVSGTYNMIHPNPYIRDQGLAGLRVIAAACPEMGASVITVCTGTRDPDHMWRWHPANETREAWRDLLTSLSAALAIAEEYDVVLAFEPEPANVVASAVLGQKLLEELPHPRLKVVMDPANIVASDRDRPPHAVLDEAFALLGEHIAVAHVKDLDASGHFGTAGRGIVPWDHCLVLFRGAAFAGPLILHSLEEEDADRALAFLQERIARASDR